MFDEQITTDNIHPSFYLIYRHTIFIIFKIQIINKCAGVEDTETSSEILRTRFVNIH